VTSRSTFTAGDAIDTPLIVSRTLHYAAAALLEGTYVFWCLIARPAFAREGGTNPLQTRFERRLIALGWASLAIAVVSGAGWLIIVGSRMSGVPVAAVLQQAVVGIVVTQTRFGRDWVWRGVLAIVLGVCLVPQIARRPVVGGIGLLVSSAFVASIIWAGHGAQPICCICLRPAPGSAASFLSYCCSPRLAVTVFLRSRLRARRR
jgi:putative copper resistance protein D